MKKIFEVTRSGLFIPFRKILRIMKVFVLLLLMTITQVLAIGVYSQNTRITLNLSGTTVANVLDEIQAKSEFDFFYNNKLIDVERIVSINVEDKDIYAILGELFDDTDVKYVVEDKHIILSNQLAEEKEQSNQSVIIKGKVVSGTGEAIPGVNIVVKGTTNGTISNANGEYAINILTAKPTLIFSFIGFKTQEIVANKDVINVVMAEESIGLEEVVAIGYGTLKKADVTSAVSSIKSEGFVKGSVQDVGQLIQGKVAGLSIYNVSGDPTANTQIKLRGETTLSGTSTSPLILIDGVPGDFNSVAPEDIESIDVLKDGSAAAIYGTQGSNGVIIITTKRANGKAVDHVQYSAYISTSSITKGSGMSDASDVREQIANGYRDASYDLGYNTDWLGKITKVPLSQVHNLTLQGGNTRTNYLFNSNYRALEGVFLKSNNNTGNFRVDINHSMFDDLVHINIGATNRYINYQTTGDGYSFNGYTYRQAKIYNPTAPVYNEDGTWYDEVGAFNYENPLCRLEESDGENSSNWSRVNGTITIRPIKDLSIKALVSYSKYNEKRAYYETKQHMSTKRDGKNGFVSNGQKESIDKLLELTATYNKTINYHSFSILGGYSWKDNNWHDFWINNVDFPTDDFGYYEVELGKGITEGNIYAGVGSSAASTNLIAFFSRGTYNFSDKYLVMGSLRYEAASQLYGTENPWGLFPSLSFGWRISKEPFMQALSFVNDLKLRAGYGVTGTQPSDLFLAVSTLSYDDYFYSDGEWKQTLSPSRNSNPNLRWEEKKETNIGLDYAFLNNRISGAIDLYKRKIDGLLMAYAVPVPPNLVSTTMANVGIMENKGLEILVNGVIVKNKDFEWTSSANFSTNQNKLITLSNDLYESATGYITAGATGEPIQTYTHRIDEGGKIGNFYGFKVVDITDEGRWVYEDANGDHKTASEGFAKVDSNKMVLGNGIPQFNAGWSNTFRYKNFDLNINMRGAFGFKILNFERMYLENTQTVSYNRLRSAYDKVFGKAILSTTEDLEFNSYYIENGNYWKIQNITLGYNIKTEKLKYIKMARIYASCLNALTFTKYKGNDPEVQVDGLEPGNDYRDKYPTTNTFTFGIDVTF